MTRLKEEAQEYNPSHILNIADLDVVDINLDLMEDKEAEFPYKYILVEGKKYRVPASVILQLKAILEERPELRKIKVKKTGEGLNTNYTVIPLV